jgi:hypothetical protein
MRYIKDTTGRFLMRPHYDPAELDRECEAILSKFFGGRFPIPIETDDLTRLIERHTSDFDPGADLSCYGRDVEGVTEFKPGQKPRVRIATALADGADRQNQPPPSEVTLSRYCTLEQVLPLESDTVRLNSD